MNRVLREDAVTNTIDTVFKMAKGTMDPEGYENHNKINYSYSSLAQAASSLIAVFPVIASRTISFQTAQKITKFIEQKACHLFMLALQQANISDAKSGIEYLRHFHQNLDMGSSGVDEVIRTMQTWMRAYGKFEENAKLSILDIEDEEPIFEAEDAELTAKDINNVLKAMKELSEIKVYDTDLNPSSIDNFMINDPKDGKYNISIRKYKHINEATPQGGGSGQTGGSNTPSGSGSNSNSSSKSHKRSGGGGGRGTYYRPEEDEEARRNSGNNVSILKDQDIKKMNDAVPSLLVVRFYQSTTATVATEFLIGVKSKVIGVNTPEILRRIMNDNKDGKKFLNFMRTITGEIKASEFLLGLSRMKEDLKSVKVKGSAGKMWNLLKNRADAAREQVKYKQLNDYSAITTVLISRADADDLFREENFDIFNVSNALHFMDSYNLMAFAIVDDALEKFDIMFDDGSKMFEEISYTMLDRETKDESYKKLINLMAASR